MGAKAEYLEDEHVFGVEGSKSSGFGRDGFKAVWEDKRWGGRAKNLGEEEGHHTPGRRGRGQWN